jgi:hypothetical protein
MNAFFTKVFRALFFATCLAAGLWTAPALATFHLWVIAEIYSNADGTVQYVELSTPSGGQNFLASHTLAMTGGATYNIPSNLSGDTTNKHVLFATQGFANLGIVTPDYIIPAGFVNVAGGTIVYASGFDQVTYPALPTDGHAIDRTGATKTPAPTNFAGQTGTLQASFTPQAGFWYNPAEGGRGYVIEQHGNNLFVGGFMYDANGNAIWYASGPGAMANGTTYTGVWQQYGGGETLTGSYKAPAVVNAGVGSITLVFLTPSTATLTLPDGRQIQLQRYPF